MFQRLGICILIALLCVGCDAAAKQQQAEQARRAAIAKKLKQMGEEMHKTTNTDSLADESVNDSP